MGGESNRASARRLSNCEGRRYVAPASECGMWSAECGMSAHASLAGGHDDRDVGRLLLQVARDVAHVADYETVPARADLARVPVVNRRDVEAALPKPRVLHQRPADASRPDEHDAVRPLQPQDVAQARGELGDGVAEPPLAERAEEREILTHLRRRGRAAAGELGGGDGGLAQCVELLEEPQVQREPPDCAPGNLPHIVNDFTISPSSARAARTPRGATSRAAPPDRGRAAAIP